MITLYFATLPTSTEEQFTILNDPSFETSVFFNMTQCTSNDKVSTTYILFKKFLKFI